METRFEDTFTKDQIKRLDELIERYKDYDSDKIFERLWKMTYAPLAAIIDEGLGIINFDTLNNVQIRDYILSKLNKKDIIKVRRTIVNDKLFRAFNNDKFAVQRLDEVIKHIFSKRTLKDIEKICYKLNSITNSSVLDGLQELGLSEKEAIYYFNYAKDIFNFFSKEYDYCIQKNRLKENNKETLLDLIVKLYDNKNIVLDFIEESKSFSKIYENYYAKEYSIINLLKISEAALSAKGILEKSEKLKELGINPDWVLNNIDVISKLLSADFYNNFNS